MSIVLKIEQAKKRFGEVEALRGVDLELRQGEWLALLGPNGAGKTTLIRTITGRVRLDHGQITLLGGRGEAELTASRRRLGIVPQEIALYQIMSPRENMQAFGRLMDVRGAELEERIDWALEWTGLSKRADQQVLGFSGGMKRRLNIACAVLHQPEVLLLDEPTAGVDPQSRQMIWEMLEHLRQAGASLLHTTHQLDEAQQLCDRIVIVDHGKAIAAGTLAQLIEQTVGTKGQLSLDLDRPLEPDHPLVARRRMTVDDHTVSCQVGKLTVDLPAILQDLEQTGRQIQSLRLDSPSLHTVFLQLTGRELRE